MRAREGTTMSRIAAVIAAVALAGPALAEDAPVAQPVSAKAASPADRGAARGMTKTERKVAPAASDAAKRKLPFDDGSKAEREPARPEGPRPAAR